MTALRHLLCAAPLLAALAVQAQDADSTPSNPGPQALTGTLAQVHASGSIALAYRGSSVPFSYLGAQGQRTHGRQTIALIGKQPFRRIQDAGRRIVTGVFHDSLSGVQTTIQTDVLNLCLGLIEIKNYFCAKKQKKTVDGRHQK